ncbi:MAG TPA: tetratricopeptide repeat protein [Terriglobales bacterium]|nr:tetratricopeptide repeat protein [Terriglobales bacterium]
MFPLLIVSLFASAQAAGKSSGDAPQAARKAIAAAEQGRCRESLPILKTSVRQVSDADLKRKVALAGVRCSMTIGQTESALEFLQIMARDFPRDPEALYTEVHAYSDLSTHASQILAQAAPSSPQAHELLAESYETQGKWEEAEKEYRAILERDPNFPGMHFRIGRLLLSKPNPPPDVVEEAEREFKQELTIDPSNAGAEYVLGELSRQSQRWQEAVDHFSRAAKLDPQFGEAFLGLGVSLISLKRYSEALVPLETAVKLEPRNPDAHYNLATAYTRAGRKQDGEKEFAIHQQLIGTQGGSVNRGSSNSQPQ